MVIPYHHKGIHLVQVAEVGIELVLAVADAVIVQVHNLMVGIMVTVAGAIPAPPRPIDPASFPSVAEVERQGEELVVADESVASAEPVVAATIGRRPPTIEVGPAAAEAELPPLDAYSLRLVAYRPLFDAGVNVRHSPALTGLAGSARVHVNPADLDRLGVTTGGSVRVTSTRATHLLEAVSDPGVPRGIALIHANQAGGRANVLIDGNAPVTDVRVERP